MSVYVNKTTGTFLSPDLALGGELPLIEEFLGTWKQNTIKARKSSEETPLPEIKSIIPLSENEIPGIEKWKAAQPIKSLEVSDFKSLLKSFRLPLREFKLQSFVEYEARVFEDEILFPIRYIGKAIL